LTKKLFMAIVMGLGFALTALPAPADYIYVQVGPPAAVYEVVPARPHAGYVWVGGYYRWYGGRYTWVHGRYVQHAGNWCGGQWRHTPKRGYYWSNGRWC
jgi:hypothetical protein